VEHLHKADCAATGHISNWFCKVVRVVKVILCWLVLHIKHDFTQVTTYILRIMVPVGGQSRTNTQFGVWSAIFGIRIFSNAALCKIFGDRKMTVPSCLLVRLLLCHVTIFCGEVWKKMHTKKINTHTHTGYPYRVQQMCSIGKCYTGTSNSFQ
jgi:hypothetical protein